MKGTWMVGCDGTFQVEEDGPRVIEPKGADASVRMQKVWRYCF